MSYINFQMVILDLTFDNLSMSKWQKFSQDGSKLDQNVAFNQLLM